MFFLVLEDSGGKIKRVSWEAAAAAQQLAGGAGVTAVVIGAQTQALAAEAANHGFAAVIRIEHPLLAQYTADGYVAALHATAPIQETPAYAVFPHTYQVRDFAPALATRMGQVLIWRRDRHR